MTGSSQPGLPLAALDLRSADVIPWGPGQAKLRWQAWRDRPARGRLVLVTAMSPALSGEGKTTVAIGLVDALRRLGHSAVAALRQPSMGPVFGMKGGATGGGKASLVPHDSINLHFTGDFHAITSAHNLLSAILDNHLQRGSLGLDPRRLTWPRVLDVNDRALRHCLIGLGGPSHGVPREERFEITAASEIMAILALSRDWDQLRQRLARIVVGTTADGELVRAEQVGATGAMAALLRDAMLPNLVQTAEGSPALLHCGPFANIAHGTSSLTGTLAGLRLADLVVQEAGFGADLGAEKFLNIYCRELGQTPSLAVLVLSLRGLKFHGGVSADHLALPDREALARGLANPLHHLRALSRFGLPCVVAVNVRADEESEEHRLVLETIRAEGCPAVGVDVFGQGGEGALELAERVAQCGSPAAIRHSYGMDESLAEKIGHIARGVYGAHDVEYTPDASRQLALLQRQGLGSSYVCMAKTQYSLSDDPKRVGVPEAFLFRVREIKLAAGAGMVVPIAGQMQTMPGLPAHPNAEHIHLGDDGEIQGLS